MPKESYAQIPPNSTGPLVRTVDVPTTVDGVAVVVDQQVVALADGQGNLIEPDWRATRRSEEAQLIAAMNAQGTLNLTRYGERGSLVDRRGSVGRGTR